MSVTKSVTPGVTPLRSVTVRNRVKEISVELLLQWAYATEKVRGTPSWGSGGAGVGFGEAAEAAGSGCHPDALIVDRVVEQLSESAAHLVRDHALACTRPDWRPNARHRFEPLQRSVRHPHLAEAMYTHPSTCRCGGAAHLCDVRQVVWPRGEEALPYCPIVERDNPDDVRLFREAWYIPWVSHLRVIRDALSAQPRQFDLVAHRVTETLPPLTPWLSKNPLDGQIRHL